MTALPKHILRTITLLLVVSLAAGGCGVYFNTFYNAKKAFNDAEGTRKSSKGPTPMIKKQSYETAINKALKVIENHPNSKYYDDAVYVLGVSYYWTGQYSKAERRFHEILTNYPKSKYAKDSRLYLAQALLHEDEVSDAMDIFESLFNSKVSREQKAQAAIALGDFHFENKDYKTAGQYYLAVRDSLGNDQEKLAAQVKIADGLFDRWKYSDALAAYLQVLGLNPGKNEKYHALFQSAICSYRMMRIDEGLDYLRTLADDQIYFDSLPRLQLTMAEGYDLDDELDEAEAMYSKVADEAGNNRVAASEAYYNLGLIYQYDLDDLTRAKDAYDKAVAAYRSGESGQLALAQSSDIGKLETFKESAKELDSTATQDMIDEAAYTQYQLAELYWFQLNKPDSGMNEMRYVADSFPTAYDAPRAMIALSQMILDQTSDTAASDSILHAMLERYPHSDYVPEALEQLGLLGTPADTGYAERYIHLAESFVGDTVEVDSARAYYQKVVDDYPDSKFYLQARFALIWLTEQYDSPGDSTVIFAYNEFADSFPGSPWGQEAMNRTQYRPTNQNRGQPGQTGGDSLLAQQEADTTGSNGFVVNEKGDTTGYVDPSVERYKASDGTLAVDLPADVKPMEVREEFVYPTEAYSSRWEGDLYFQIQLDFSGQVTDIVQKSFADVDEINLRAQESLRSTTFDTRLLRPEMIGKWFVYKFRVKLPDHLR